MATTSVRPPPAEVVGRQFVRDPDLWLLVAAVAVAVLSALQIFLFPLGRSLSEYALSGRELLLGGAPATTYWSLRAPGIAILNALVQSTLGSSTMAIRAVEVACLSGLAFTATKLLKRVAGYERIGTIAAGLLIFVHAQLEYEHTGQPELYATCLLAVAAWLTLRSPTRHDRFLQFAGIGLLVGLSTLFAPLYALTLIPLAACTARAEREEREGLAPLFAVLAMVAGWLVGPLTLALWLRQKQALGIFVTDWVKPEFALWFSWSIEGWLEWTYYVIDRLLLRQSAIIPAGCVVAYTLPTLCREELRGRKLLLQLVIVLVLGFSLSGESNPGRLSGALPLLSMLAAIGIYKLYRRLLLQGPAALAAFWSGLFLLAALCTAVGVSPGSYWWRSFVRLKFMAHVMPYHAVELLEADLYNNGQVNLQAISHVASTLDELGKSGNCLIQGDEPQLLWRLKQRPRARLIRPLPQDMANAAPELDVKMSEALAKLSPALYVTSPWASAQPPGSLATRLGPSRDAVAEHSTLLSVTDGWAIWGPMKQPENSP